MKKKNNQIFTEQDLPFQKIKSKHQKIHTKRRGISNMIAKALVGTALSGDPSGTVTGIVVDKAVDKILP